MPKIGSLWMGILCILVGILVLVFPELLRWSLGIFLIIVGVLMLLRR